MTQPLMQLVALKAYILKSIMLAELQRIAFDRVNGCIYWREGRILGEAKVWRTSAFSTNWNSICIKMTSKNWTALHSQERDSKPGKLMQLCCLLRNSLWWLWVEYSRTIFFIHIPTHKLPGWLGMEWSIGKEMAASTLCGLKETSCIGIGSND